jgi:preprotein translocase subunit YajC
MCDTLYKKINVFKEKEVFTKNYELIKDIEEKISTNNYRLEEISEKYNTRLFEQIAQISNNKLLQEVKIEYDTINKNNKELKNQLESIPNINTLDGYKEYEEYVTINKELFLIEKKSYEFWQPFKEYGYMLTFVIPLLLLFGFFYFKTKRKELRGENYNPIVKIISTHISFILTLPIIFYTLSLVYHVIPKTLLKKLIDFLTEIGLLSILNYLSIAIVVLIFGGLIYYVQKRTARLKEEKVHTKDYKKLLSFSQCFVCEYKIDYTKNYCSFCDTTLHDTCKNCNEQTTFHEDYCKSCGIKK